MIRDQVRSPLTAALIIVFCSMLAIMFLFELVKQIVFPDISLWESHGITIIVTGTLAIALVYYPLRDALAESRRAKEALVQQKAAEENLRQSEAQYHTFIESAEDSIYTVDPMLRYLMMNTRHLARQGMQPDHYLGKSYSDFHSPDQVREFSDQVKIVVETQPLHAEYDRPAGYFLKKLNPVIDPADNKVIAVTVISTEITDRKHAEKKLEDTNRKLNLLNDITRHDILNQLTVLNSYLQLAEDRSSDQVVSKYLVKSEQCTEAIHSQILFARDYQEIGVESPLWQKVSDTIMQARMPLKIASLSVDASCAVEIFADPLLEKVFYNLMENSLKYGGPSVDVRFSCRKDGDGFIISCEDNGEGISEEDKGKIFNRGYGKNTGLGLFLIKEILAITGISITENGDPGKGTRFEMRVPPGSFRFPGDDNENPCK